MFLPLMFDYYSCIEEPNESVCLESLAPPFPKKNNKKAFEMSWVSGPMSIVPPLIQKKKFKTIFVGNEYENIIEYLVSTANIEIISIIKP